jgi:hypothetical protein
MTKAATISVGLVSHTNAGKTTLARTLLRRDIGEIADRAHVTEVAERHVLLESAQGDVLALWDTPGFGDSMRLYSRLSQSKSPLGWALTQVWDRFADRGFWAAQQIIRNAREECDVVLYVVNASESPDEARYIAVEMQILDWIDKPVIVVLNQLGPPRTQAGADAEIALWRASVGGHRCVRGILPLDAFGRCWVQEDALLEQVQAVLPEALKPAGARLRAAWHARNLDVFERSMQLLARQLARTAVDEEPIAELDVQQKIRGWVANIATGAERVPADIERAQRMLSERLDIATREATDAIIQLHGLSGRAATDPLRALAHELAIERPTDQHKASVFGGLLSGAASGIAADLVAGGLTFGAGALIGGLVGALGARGLTQAYNIVTGRDQGRVRWSDELLTRRVAAALLGYLAVAHFGRGRGEFVRPTTPEHWQRAIDSMTRHRATLEAAWRAARAGDREQTEKTLLEAVTALTKDVMTALYPQSTAALAKASTRGD